MTDPNKWNRIIENYNAFKNWLDDNSFDWNVNGEKTFAFHDVPMGHPIWLIGLKYQNGETSVSIVSTKSKRKTDDFDFQKVTINELKQKLKQLDR